MPNEVPAVVLTIVDYFASVGRESANGVTSAGVLC
ncbi:MAG: hypothetical protein RI985_1332, partial [Chloroflexota bacterium]